MVEEDGRVFHLVPEERRAWHAGRGVWQGQDDCNGASIGVEIVNPGHEFGYRAFPDAQVAAVIAFVVFMERALRKIRIQYPRRQVGMKVYDGQSSHLPIKVNPAGVIPAIFASSLLLLPITISTFSGNQTGPVMSTILAYFGPGQPLYLLFFAAMIIFFSYFYTQNVAFKSDDVAENLKNQGGFIPGIRPGKRTQEYLDYVVNRVLVIGSLYLALVCLLPEAIRDSRTQK